MDAEELRQVSKDNIPLGKIENEWNRIENLMVSAAKQGERSVRVVIPYILHEKIGDKLLEEDYSLKVKSKNVLKGVVIDITW